MLYDCLALQGALFVEVDLVDKPTIQRLNRDNRGVDKPTDVLSFPFLEFAYGADGVTPLHTPFDQARYPFEWLAGTQ
ncbi:MAG: rRNA maturation RNAse YbeY, partial [Firmicutes bacterium]|nr:rRNA maturation RNAse YbeY [Bacillota bacterium]